MARTSPWDRRSLSMSRPMRWLSLAAARSTSPAGPPPVAGKSLAPQRQNLPSLSASHPDAGNPVAAANQNPADDEFDPSPLKLAHAPPAALTHPHPAHHHCLSSRAQRGICYCSSSGSTLSHSLGEQDISLKILTPAGKSPDSNVVESRYEVRSGSISRL